MDLWTLAAERAAKWWAGKGGRDSDWREWVGVAWEGIASRAESRARRGLPPMDGQQVLQAARSALVDEVRRGAGGYAATRYRDALLTSASQYGDDFQLSDWAPASVVVPDLPDMRRHWQRWSREEETVLRKALRQRATATEIAAGLGRTAPGVARKCKSMGIGPGRGWRTGGAAAADAVRRSEFLALFNAGVPLPEVARLQGVRRDWAQRMARYLFRAGRLVEMAPRYVPSAGVMS